MVDLVGVNLDILTNSLQNWATTNFGEVRIHNVGSRETCIPPPMDTDFDVLVYYKSDLFGLLDVVLKNLGYEPNGQDYGDQSDFVSYKSKDKDNVINIILTKHLDFEYNFLLATKVCKKLNLLHKLDRIKVFKGIIDNEWS